MNILVIGNGFDIAHGLPTTYGNFLDWIDYIIKYRDTNLSTGNLGRCKQEVIDRLIDIYNNKHEVYNELINLCTNNVWIEYFLKKDNYQNKGWVAFEAEISSIIQALEYMRNFDKEVQPQSVPGFSMDHNNKYNLARKILTLLNAPISTKDLNEELYYEQIIKPLEIDLDNLIRCLEIYLIECIEKLDIKMKPQEIIKLLEDNGVDKILSFNYTNTYHRLYDSIYNNEKDEKYRYHFIHGRARDKENYQYNNMVLGINEYLNDDLKSNDLRFIYFKKYFQRIHKLTGARYLDWLEEIENGRAIMNGEQDHIYFFGHSLDITDKDILQDLILKTTANITIYYYNHYVYATQISNLVQVLGQDRLIRLVSGPQGRIEFVEQVR